MCWKGTAPHETTSRDFSGRRRHRLHRPGPRRGAAPARHAASAAFSARRPSRVAQGGGSLGLSRGYADFEELLADPAVDVVHIAVAEPLALRAGAGRASAAGKHVVCEKPLAMTSAEAAELVRLAEAHAGLVTAVNYNIRFYPLCLRGARDGPRPARSATSSTSPAAICRIGCCYADGLQLACRGRRRRRPACGRGHRHALARSRRLHHRPACRVAFGRSVDPPPRPATTGQRGHGSIHRQAAIRRTRSAGSSG